MPEESYISQSENERKSVSEMGINGYHQAQSDRERLNSKKQVKKSKSKLEKMKKLIKREVEEFNSPGYRSNKETVEQFTRYRSLKIAKEREDIVESRSLGMKVSLF